MAQLTLEQIKILADEMWEGCRGCDDMDKYMWTNGFVIGAISMLGTPLSEIEARMKEMDENKQITMAQQTAVEWFWIHLPENISKEYFDLFKQAKQMETEQIAEAYRVGVEEDVYNNPLKTGQEYYNETYITNK